MHNDGDVLPVLCIPTVGIECSQLLSFTEKVVILTLKTWCRSGRCLPTPEIGDTR